MAEVIIRAKVYVENPEEIEKVKGEIEKIVDLEKSGIEELGFGIKVLKVVIVADESKGTDELEAALGGVPGVSQVEIESVDRALG
ncbi:elongation factor 1-beta [Candidatus Micrarchaeota archaeon]|nr:elongation factor 1-beta [Candidatus Micrarchaeota archaeon]